jgi:hypothetical protein
VAFQKCPQQGGVRYDASLSDSIGSGKEDQVARKHPDIPGVQPPKGRRSERQFHRFSGEHIISTPLGDVKWRSFSVCSTAQLANLTSRKWSSTHINGLRAGSSGPHHHTVFDACRSRRALKLALRYQQMLHASACGRMMHLSCFQVYNSSRNAGFEQPSLGVQSLS